jgi:hypothetical protein
MASEEMAVKAAKAKVDFEIEREADERVMVGPLCAPKWLKRVC